MCFALYVTVPFMQHVLSYTTIPLFLILLMREKLTSPSIKILFVILFYALFSLFFLKSSNKVIYDIFNHDSDITCWICQNSDTTYYICKSFDINYSINENVNDNILIGKHKNKANQIQRYMKF